jgi:hypothetical protein
MNNLVAPEDFPEEEENVSVGREIVSRKDAKNLGLSRYFTGKPCKYGHIDERWTAGGSCVTCLRDRVKHKMRERIKTPEHKEYMRKYREDKKNGIPRPRKKSLATSALEKAEAEGQKYFFTGEPCEHGHVAHRYVNNRACVECHRVRGEEKRSDPDYVEYMKNYLKERRKAPGYNEGFREYMREKRKDPEYREYMNKRSREYTRNRRANDEEYRQRENAKQRERKKEKMKDPVYRRERQEYMKKYAKEWRQRPEVRERQNRLSNERRRKPEARRKKNERNKKRYEEDVNHRIKLLMRSAVRRTMKSLMLGDVEGSTRHIDFTAGELRERLQDSLYEFYDTYPIDKWPEEMPEDVEEAFHAGWHIDHICPFSEYMKKVPEEASKEERMEIIREANSLYNLRLLPAELNLSRNDDPYGLDRLHYAGIDYIPDDVTPDLPES